MKRAARGRNGMYARVFRIVSHCSIVRDRPAGTGRIDPQGARKDMTNGGSHSPNSRSRGACRGGATLEHRKGECDSGSWDPVETAFFMVLATADDLQHCRRGGTWMLQSVRTHQTLCKGRSGRDDSRYMVASARQRKPSSMLCKCSYFVVKCN